jgi:hypothetical protein
MIDWEALGRCILRFVPSHHISSPNFKDSILGHLVPSLTSQSRHLTHSLFIATPLLPCSDVDGGIKKFTGNDEFGDANDHLTKAIHAFSHFTAVYTHENLVLCDLQGNNVQCHCALF